MTESASVPPDDRDWTYVITDGCDECGFVPQAVRLTGDRLRAALPLWRQALAADDALHRPAPTVWSTTEYACHVRDAGRIFRRRLERMLAEDNPLFDNWDQDLTAVEERYDRQEPAAVAPALEAEVEAIAALFDSVGDEDWDRPGRRSNGSVFTVATFAVYFLHDLEHHGYDVTKRSAPAG